MTARDLLLVVQIAICAVLVTSSLVAVRGLVRSLHSNFGFAPQGAMLVDTDLDMAGYSGDQVPVMQRRAIDAVAAIPGVTAAGHHRPVTVESGMEQRRRVQRQHDGHKGVECRCGGNEVLHFSGIFPCGRDNAAGRKIADLA